MSTTNTAFFCPKCSGAAVDVSALVGGDSTCRSCGWKGSQKELISYGFTQEMGSDDQVAMLFAREMATLISKNATPYIALLSKWGFLNLNEKDSVSTAARYAKAIAAAAAKAILEEREAIEKEKCHG